MESWRKVISESKDIFDVNKFLTPEFQGMVLKVDEKYIMVDPETASSFVTIPDLDEIEVPPDTNVRLLMISELPTEISNMLADYEVQYPLQPSQNMPEIPEASNVEIYRFKYVPDDPYQNAFTLNIDDIMTRDQSKVWEANEHSLWRGGLQGAQARSAIVKAGMKVVGPGRVYSSRTHDDGWTIAGAAECYMQWVNNFKAHHPKYGAVEGNFEEWVYYDTKEGLKDFMKKHPIDVWNYMDI